MFLVCVLVFVNFVVVGQLFFGFCTDEQSEILSKN